MKNLLILALSIVLFSCAENTFIPNTDNNAMEGDWEIIVVDDADALISKEEFLTSILHEKYQKGDVFHFEKGSQFTLKSDQGNEKLKGQYGFNKEGTEIILQVSPDQHQLIYEMMKEENQIKLNVQTPGELVNLVIQSRN